MNTKEKIASYDFSKFNELGYYFYDKAVWTIGDFYLEKQGKYVAELLCININNLSYCKFKEEYDCDCNEIETPLEITLEEHFALHEFILSQINKKEVQ